MSAAAPSPPPSRERDGVLVAVLVAAFALCLHAITVPILHPDQMALRPLFLPDHAPFNPGWFEKPPGYSYMNWLLATAPTTILRRAFGLAPARALELELIASRLVAAGFLLGTAALIYAIARRAFGLAAARVVAVLLATSAGMIAFVHQLTADVPVTFWMVLAFHFALALLRADRTLDYVAAGLCTGIATATKYNGLGVGIAIVVAHALRVLCVPPPRPWATLVVHRGLWLGLAMVAVGFVLANPYAVLDATTFVADFRYNAIVTPVYEGQTGTSYGAFFARIADVIGLPATVLALLAAAAALVVTLRARRLGPAEATFVCTLAVVLLYYATFARFPRLETRFVLPIVPFVLLLAAPAVAAVRARGALAGVVAVLVAYNVACGALVGTRFLGDPRLAALAWLRAHVAPTSTLELDAYSPTGLAALSGWSVATMPFVDGRERLFREVFPGDTFVNGTPEQQRAADAKMAWFAPAAFAERAPDFVVLSSLYYDRFVTPGRRRDLYPEMTAFFTTLLDGQTTYRIVFDQRTDPVPAVVYPRAIDFLDNRATVLQRDAVGGRARK